MKKYFMYLFAVCMLSFSLVACSDDDSPFQGTDNHILTFVLNADGVSYEGIISDGKITVTVPKNVSLANAAAAYTLCEQAVISPDPASVSDWSEELQFRVTAYNGAVKDYIYTVEYSDVTNESDVVLLTQADVNAFGNTGVTVIDGNLLIGSNAVSDDPITDLSPLSALREVAYNVSISSSFAGTDLEGISGLEKVGNLIIGTSNASVSLPAEEVTINLPNLKQVGMISINCENVKTASFPQLKSCGSIYFNDKNLASVDFSALKDCAGDITFSALSSSINAALQNLSFPELESIFGSFVMTYYTGLTSASFDKLTNVGTDFRMGNVAGYNADMTSVENISLPVLNKVGATLAFYTSKMESLSLPELVEVGSLSMKAGSSMTTSILTELNCPKLETIKDGLDLQYMSIPAIDFPMLKSVASCNLGNLSNLRTVNMSSVDVVNSLSIILSRNSQITDINLKDGLTADVTINCATQNPQFALNVETIKGALSLTNMKGPKVEYPKLKHVGALSMGMNGTPDLTEVSYPNLLTVDGELKLSMSRLETFNAPQLTTVGDFTYSGSLKLTTMDLHSLTEITGNFTLTGGTSEYMANQYQLANLDAFSSLQRVGGKVSISGFSKLTDYSGLKNLIPNITEEQWVMGVYNAYSPTYQDMKDGKYTLSQN